MSELGEPVAVGMIDEEEIKCPFDHEFEPLKLENDLIGVGGTLARQLGNATGTHLYAGKCAQLDPKYKPEYPDKAKDKIPNPKKVADHPFKDKKKCVKIPFTTPTGTVHHYY